MPAWASAWTRVGANRSLPQPPQGWEAGPQSPARAGKARGRLGKVRGHTTGLLQFFLNFSQQETANWSVFGCCVYNFHPGGWILEEPVAEGRAWRGNSMYRVHLAWLPFPRLRPLLFFVFTVRLYPKRDSGRRTLESNLTHNQCVGFPQQQQGLVRLGRASPAPYAERMTSRHGLPARAPPHPTGGRGLDFQRFRASRSTSLRA